MYQYLVPFGVAVSRAFSNYCKFTGRASRSEFWWFYLFNLAVLFVLGTFEAFFAAAGGEGSPRSIIFYSLQALWGLVTLLPWLGLYWRRLHDIGKSGWNILWSLLPLAGAIILLVYFCRGSEMRPNQYGPVPNMADNGNLFPPTPPYNPKY